MNHSEAAESIKQTVTAIRRAGGNSHNVLGGNLPEFLAHIDEMADAIIDSETGREDWVTVYTQQGPFRATLGYCTVEVWHDDEKLAEASSVDGILSQLRDYKVAKVIDRAKGTGTYIRDESGPEPTTGGYKGGWRKERSKLAV